MTLRTPEQLLEKLPAGNVQEIVTTQENLTNTRWPLRDKYLVGPVLVDTTTGQTKLELIFNSYTPITRRSLVELTLSLIGRLPASLGVKAEFHGAAFGIGKGQYLTQSITIQKPSLPTT